jgi:hypothetical protein
MDQNIRQNHWKIAMLPRLQIDTLVATFLLKYFGEEKFPGIGNAEYIFLIDIPPDKAREDFEKEGYIFLDMGGGIFDHHTAKTEGREKCLSQLVAEYLGIHNNRALKNMLDYAWRDDTKGKGTISNDPIDRAFGLSGLINNMNRMLPDDQESVLRAIMPLLLAHYLEEKKRAEDFPAEYKMKLENGQLTIATIPTARGEVKIVSIETDEIGMAGFLRARKEVQADIVIQKTSSGHINIVTQQKRMFDLSEIAARIRKNELAAKGDARAVDEAELRLPGKMTGIEEWYFDARAKTIQNGGIRPQWTNPTRLSLAAIGQIIKEGAAIKL